MQQATKRSLVAIGWKYLQAGTEFGFPNLPHPPASQLDEAQFERWVAECLLRLQALAKYLALSSLQDPAASKLLRKIRLLIKGYSRDRIGR
jgi:hypothetical protein